MPLRSGASGKRVSKGSPISRIIPRRAKEIEPQDLGVKFPGLSSFDIEIKPADLADYATIGKDLGLLRTSIDVTKLIAK